MKRLAYLSAVLLLLAACTKEEPGTTPEPVAEATLAGTTWIGTYDDDFQGYPATLTWTLYFTDGNAGTLHFDLVIAAQPEPSMDDAFTYTFDGTEGTLHSDNMAEPGHFTFDSATGTITMHLQVGDGSVTLGGETVFYPADEPHETFPVNTSWEAEQQLPSGDTLMSVTWGLDFWEYGWGGQVNYCAAGTCAGTSFFWHYDSASHSGTVTLDGTQHPFSYDPATDILTLEYSTTVYGTAIPIGGVLTFRRQAVE